MRYVIIGCGRAGKRHEDTLSKRFGIKHPDIVDPLYYSGFSFEYFRDAMERGKPIEGAPWDFAVVASPPEFHVQQVSYLLDMSIPVLVEKPLCGLGQLEEAEELLSHPNADKVMVAYNYRFNPDMPLKETVAINGQRDRFWETYSSQYRPEIPKWGLLLDHVSHDIDNLRLLSGREISLIYSVEYKTYSAGGKTSMFNEVSLDVDGVFEGIIAKSFRVKEFVSLTHKETRRDCYIDEVVENKVYRHQVTANPEMFVEMWRCFFENLTNNQPQSQSSLHNAFETQKVLQAIADLAEWDKTGFPEGGGS